MPATATSESVTPTRARRDEASLRTWRLIAWIAGVFSVLVGLVMLAGHIQTPAVDPLRSPQLGTYKEQLRLNPADEGLKQQIRQLDLQQRQRYFRQLSQRESGVYLLLGGVAVLVLAVTQAARRQRELPMPQPKTETAVPAAARAASAARWSVAASGAAVGALLFVLGFGLTTALPRRGEDIDKLLGSGAGGVAATASDAASLAELAQNWPRFRGVGGGGVSPPAILGLILPWLIYGWLG